MQSAATSGASEKPSCFPFARCFWNVAVFNSFHRTVLPPTFLKVSARHSFADAARFRADTDAAVAVLTA